ncbi:uncharacterized protein Z520_09664 [Fonsecaea multimorphosa CBS 102226]|uniref:Uncharacterized protein n=1 Tax=Fonsecaea multimorphosa CBS 102226 TaxID=1442371 RepID=A0A0D2KD12_9EURO|nr:uncharacterized protein Z520_09664 [Fonsecaea multimorphosa CBS 102226]KIX94618.1 hypothetical protein Z520_09664 [Fonsecaea multimorphosa CBS 102226]OAL20326.1 hypothetical protein AYO22_09038 [Fonsecaea multimorphosa]
MTDHNKQDKVDTGSQHGLPFSTPARPRTTVEHESSGSPQRPSYSPVTPTLSHTSLASYDGVGGDLPPAQWMDEPPEPLPVSLDDNPDAMALRATLSILQIQRQQALRDMQDLDKMKKAALEDPEQFIKDLQTGKLSRSPRSGVDVDGLEPVTAEDKETDTSKFGHFPHAQNIVRTPPVEWAKYHIVGEPLDRIHKTQQQYPGATDEALESRDRPQPHTIAAPYRPFVDKLDQARTPSNPRHSES